jgi:antitoxin component of RelBE/YafQ-DinJ toxin-antitoxin module
MNDVMVTARMSRAKKATGNEKLASLGTSASAAINGLYDYVIEFGRLPFQGDESLTGEEIAQRIALVDSIPLATSRFAHMTDGQIRRERLGLA